MLRVIELNLLISTTFPGKFNNVIVTERKDDQDRKQGVEVEIRSSEESVGLYGILQVY